MGGSDPTYNYPAQPSYGEALKDSLSAQVDLLRGTGDFSDTGGLKELTEKYEAPLRKQTAQIDTDVLRQTILGGEGKTTDQEGRVITGYTTPEPAGGGSALGQYQIVNLGGEIRKTPGKGQSYGFQISSYGLVDKDGNVVLTAEDSPKTVTDGIGFGTGTTAGSGVASLMAQAKEQGLLTPQQAEAGKKAEPIYETDPETGEPRIYKDDDGNVLSGQKIARSGDGMVDLLGDTRDITQYDTRTATQEDVNAGLADAVGDTFIAETQTADQAGFREGEFMGLSALAEDVQAGNLSRQRERDLQDVARLSPLYSEIMEDYKPGTKAAVSDARKVLDAQKATLTGAGAIDAPASVAENMGDITSEGMSYAMARPADALAAPTSYKPSADIAGGQIGADALRKALMSDAETSLAGGLTDREERQISEAMKAQSTMMGRTFDQSAGIAEAKARTLEDRNRQALNRQYAQQVLGQEAGLQQSDLGRGLQASLANQQAANRAAEFGVGSGMQQELAGAQMDQQTALANQAMQQEAAKYTAQEAMQAQLANEANRQQAASFDVNALQQQQRLNEQLKQAGTLGYVDAATRLAALEDTTTLDPFQAVLNRAGGGSLAGGNQLFGTAQYGLQSGPQYLNPEAGLGFISNQATNAANMFGAQQMADATVRGSQIAAGGNILSSFIPKIEFCWVAREVYGAHNPAWLDFRQWMFSSAPKWFFKLYLTFGERFANFISNKPRLKARIRLWMDSKIGR